MFERNIEIQVDEDEFGVALLMEKSRSDDTLLTIDFNLRSRNNVRTLPSPVRILII